MPKSSTRYAPRRACGRERAFTQGRPCSAALEERDRTAGALVFRRRSDGRHAVRALAVEVPFLRDAVDAASRLDGRCSRIGILFQLSEAHK